jgi:hypothetical protein
MQNVSNNQTNPFGKIGKIKQCRSFGALKKRRLSVNIAELPNKPINLWDDNNSLRVVIMKKCASENCIISLT